MKTRAWYIGLTLNVLLGLTLLGTGTWYFTRPATAETEVVRVPTAIATKPVPSAINKDEIYSFINEERANVGLTPYTTNPQLESSACAKAQYMQQNNYWNHIAPDGTTPWYFINQAGYTYSRAGENQAYGPYTSKGVVSAWLRSDSHRDAMLNSFTDAGICVLTGVPFQEYKSTNIIVNHFGTSQ